MKNIKNNPTIQSEVALLTEKINKEKESRAKKCMDEIQKLLKNYSCELIPSATISTKGVKCGINIEAK